MVTFFAMAILPVVALANSLEEQFLEAVASGNKAKVEQLVWQGVNVNAKETHGQTALTVAVQLGHKEMAQMLMANGADVKDARPLIAAVMVGNKDMVNVLIAKGADINAIASTSSLTPLFASISKGDLEMTKFLIDKGADVNRKTSIGNQVMSPLAWALNNRKNDIAQLLTAKGARQ